jgi:dolichol-phosphate mannosyltransferase
MKAAASTTAALGPGPTMQAGKNPALIAAGLVLLRAVYLSFPDLFPEEAYYWNYAKHLALGYLDHPPMVAWLIHLGTAAFGDHEFGVRIFALLSSLAAAFFAYRLAALLYDRQTGAMAAMLMQVLPFFFMTGIIMTPDAPLTACWAGTLYFLASAVFERRASAWMGVGVCLGLGMLSKYTIALLGPATLIFLALDPASRGWFRRFAPYGGVLLAVGIFSPVIIWNWQHDWASFAFQSAGRVKEPHRFSLHELAGAILVLLTPLGAYFAVRSLAGRPGPVAPNPDRDDSRRRLFAQVFTLAPLAVFAAFSLVHRVKLNWTGPLWLTVVPLIAAQLTALSTRRPDRPALRLGWNLTVAVCALAYFALLQQLAFGIPGLRYSSNIDLLPVGWSELGREVDVQEDALRRASKAPVRVVGMDRNFIASEAAFYDAEPAKAAFETIGAHLFGDPSLMYEYWFPAKEQDGATLLLVSFKEGSLDIPHIGEHCQPLGEIQKHLLRHNGKPLCYYFTRIVHNYRSAGYP